MVLTQEILHPARKTYQSHSASGAGWIGVATGSGCRYITPRAKIALTAEKAGIAVTGEGNQGRCSLQHDATGQALIVFGTEWFRKSSQHDQKG